MSDHRPFDPLAYDYTPEAQEVLIERIETSNPILGERLRKSRVGGGKAFGLTLCEDIARRIKADQRFSVELDVPRWEMFEPGALATPHEESAKRSWLERLLGRTSPQPKISTKRRVASWGIFSPILRSSAPDEDWLNGESGVAESYPPNCFYTWQETVEKFTSTYPGQPFVVQRYHEGVGIVVDIAWSRLLKRVIARVAWGRQGFYAGQITFSSATWDSQGPQGIFCPLSGKEICPLQSSLPLCTEPHSSAQLAQALYQAVLDMNIRIGLQFELVADHRSRYFHLVQVRPSPLRVRPPEGYVDTIPTQPPLLISPSVSRAFSVEAPAMIARMRSGNHGQENLRTLANAQGRAVEDVVKNRIVVWDDHFNKHCAEDDLGYTEAHGAVGQIAISIINSTSHGNPSRDYPKQHEQRKKLYQTLCAIGTNLQRIRLPSSKMEAHHDIVERIAAHPGSVLIISDGLVGAIYLT